MNYDSTSDTLELSEQEALELIGELSKALIYYNKFQSYGAFTLPCIADSKFASKLTFIVKD